jgi:hypothetical protein
MNIKNRLKRLENEVIDSSSVCNCKSLRTEVYTLDLTEDAPNNDLLLMGEPVPDICSFCNKPTVKTRIILQLCDQATPGLKN